MPGFQPIGERARWKTVYEMLQATPTDVIITYDELGEALALDPEADRHAIQMAMRRAAAELEAEDKRAVDSVPNKGYRIVRAPEQLGLAQRQGKKASRALVRGHSKAVNVSLDDVKDPATRRLLELTGQAFQMQMNFNRQFAVRQEQLERTMRSISDTQEAESKRASDEVARLRGEVAQLREQVEHR